MFRVGTKVPNIDVYCLLYFILLYILTFSFIFYEEPGVGSGERPWGWRGRSAPADCRGPEAEGPGEIGVLECVVTAVLADRGPVQQPSADRVEERPLCFKQKLEECRFFCAC